MWLNNGGTINSNNNWLSNWESQISDFKKFFSETENSELAKQEYKALMKAMDKFIKDNFLKKEFYADLPDWTNPEIDDICNHSASDIENRIKEGKWILFMNACISQTLYFINKLKKTFPHLSDNIDLCIEILKLTQMGMNSAHTFIQIKIPDQEPLIIDFAHDNDVFVYQWKYTNRSKLATKTETIHTVPANSFTEDDTIFDIAIKWNILKQEDFDSSSHKLSNDFFSHMMNSRKWQLKNHNSKKKFENWQKNNKEVRIIKIA